MARVEYFPKHKDKSIILNIYLFLHSFNTYLLSTNSLRDATYNIRDSVMSKQDEIPTNTVDCKRRKAIE